MEVVFEVGCREFNIVYRYTDSHRGRKRAGRRAWPRWGIHVRVGLFLTWCPPHADIIIILVKKGGE